MKIFLYMFKILPFLSVLLIIMGGCSLRIGAYPLLPAVLLIPVYYWLVFRPGWLPVYSLVGIGLFYDALMGSDLGLSSLLLMLSTIAGHYSRPFLNPLNFFLIWGGFCFYSLCYILLYGVMTSGGFPLLMSWVYGMILYPLIVWALSHLHVRLQSYV